MLGRSLAGKYEIEALIGEGAMGKVYRAREIDTENAIAIKVLHKHLALDPRVGKRFHREARAASRLSHPHSLHVIGYGEDDDGTLFIAMELLHGRDMLTLLEEDAPLSAARLIEILDQSLSALGEAHRAGIIHRDFKPENVLIDKDENGNDFVKVCDFGIAKIVEADGGSAITVSGFVCGTPEYMAPEQARGEDIDHRTDLYAAGCMLYQLLTEEVPFSGDSPLGVITQHLTDYAPPPNERRPDLNIPIALSRIAERAMAKDPVHRYPDAASMREALSSVREALGALCSARIGTYSEDPTESVNVDPPDTPSLPPTKALNAATDQHVPWRIGGAILLLGVVIGALLAFWTPTSSSGSRTVTENQLIEVTVPDTPPAPPEVAPAPTETQAAPPTADADIAPPPTVSPSPANVADVRRPDRRPDRPSEPRQPTTAEERAPAPSIMMATPDPPPARAPSSYDEGRRLFLANDLHGAIRQFEQAARENPGSARIQKQLGRAYMRAGQVPQGAQAYRRYLQLAPNAPDRPIIEQLLQQHGGL